MKQVMERYQLSEGCGKLVHAQMYLIKPGTQYSILLLPFSSVSSPYRTKSYLAFSFSLQVDCGNHSL